jgi:hypothetical protein
MFGFRNRAPALVLAALALVPSLPETAEATPGLTFTCADPVRISQVNWFVEIDAVLTNTGTQTDRYDILRTVLYRPDDWTTPICVGSCYSDLLDSTSVTVSAGQDTVVGVGFNTDVDEGGGVVLIKARSFRDPTKQVTLTFAVITDGTEVLIVDDDGGEDYETYLSAAFEGSRTWGVWPRAVEAVTAADLLTFPVAAWVTGEASPAFTAADTTALGGFLDGSGRLFVTGQNIGYDLCDPASPYVSAGMTAFYEARLGAQYEADDSGATAVNGVAGDPITDGMALSLAGGDGAGNQASPSVVSPLGTGSTGIFTYQGGSDGAAVRVEKSGAKVVYLAFGFEGVNAAADREELALAVYDWLTYVGAVEDDLRPAPERASLRCYPNPFNPSVTVSLSLARGVSATVDIFDVMGRRVRRLPLSVASGDTTVQWDGRDGAGVPLASGLYTCRVTVGDGTVLTEKLVLLK